MAESGLINLAGEAFHTSDGPFISALYFAIHRSASAAHGFWMLFIE